MVVVRVAGLRGRRDVREISARLVDAGRVAALQVDLDSGTVTVDGDLPAEAVRAAIVAAGYTLSEAST